MVAMNKFETHYFLRDEQHSMNAVMRNKCEAELLAVVYELIEIFELDITLNAEALQEGGLRQLWSSCGKHAGPAGFIISVLTFIVTCAGLPDRELVELQKENLRLQNEQIKQDGGKVDVDAFQSYLETAFKNPKVAVRRSNFYRELNDNPEVTDVGFSILDERQEIVGDEIVVPKSRFMGFILETNKLPVEIDENAEIEIVAPVLRESKAQWKGIYKGEIIGFYMDDPAYRRDVLDKKVSFKNGNAIVCVLNIHKELNEVGDEIVKKYSVATVLDRIESGSSVETISGKIYRHEKRLKNAQADLFDHY